MNPPAGRQQDEDTLPLNRGFRANGSVVRWIVLGVVGLAHGVLAMLSSQRPTGETLGGAFGFVFWGAVLGALVWLLRGRRPGTFSSAFFWVALVLSGLGLVNALLRTP